MAIAPFEGNRIRLTGPLPFFLMPDALVLSKSQISRPLAPAAFVSSKTHNHRFIPAIEAVDFLSEKTGNERSRRPEPARAGGARLFRDSETVEAETVTC